MTVTKSLQGLNRKGLIRIQPGLGAFVLDEQEDECEAEREVADSIRAAMRRGMSRNDLKRVFFDTLLEDAGRDGGHCVVLIGPERGGLYERARLLESYLGDAGATVQPLSLESLEADPDGSLEKVGKAQVFATLIFDIAAVRGVLAPRGLGVLPLLGRIREDVRDDLASLAPNARIAIAASSREFLNGMMIAVEEYRSLSQSPICASTEDMGAVRRAVQWADVVVYGSLAKHKITPILPPGTRAIELLYEVDPQSVDRIRKALSVSSERTLVSNARTGE